MSLVLPRSRAAFMPGWVRDDLWRRARAVPSLDLRFADNKSLVDAVTGQNLVTFTRSSPGTYVDSAGVLRTATTNEPRFDHNPVTGESLGLLVEEQRANSIRNNTMQGAVAGTPGTLPTNWIQSALASGLTASVVGTGTLNGINYIDIRISGTTADAAGWSVHTDANAQIAASSGQSWTGSAYVAIIGGSINNIAQGLIRVVERNSGGGYITESNQSWTSAGSVLGLNRFSITRTLGSTAAFVQFGIYFQAASGAAIDITLRIGMPQLELGAFATSVIPTTGTAATRNADIVSISGSNFSSWYRQDEGTVFAEGAVAQPASGGNQFFFRFSDNSYNNSVAMNIQASGFASLATSAGGVFDGVATSITPLSANVAAKTAGGYASDNLGLSLNGASTITDTSATIPTALTRADIGSDHFGFNRVRAGYIRRLVYWGQRLPNNVLQTITQ